jgi:hypothetical protein
VVSLINYKLAFNIRDILPLSSRKGYQWSKPDSINTSARIPTNKLRKIVPDEYYVKELPQKYAKKVRLEMYFGREENHWTGFVCPFITVGNSSELALWHPSN